MRQSHPKPRKSGRLHAQAAPRREIREIMGIPMDRLFPPQKELLERGFLENGMNYLINMATGSGKSYMAELAMENVLSGGYRVICITPLRALASQQGDYWEKRFGRDTVGVFTGETVSAGVPASAYEKSRLLVMTPERFDMILRNWRTHFGWIAEVSLIVVDELHLLGLGRRGARLEGALTRIRRINPFARILGLSATMPNADRLAEWLHGGYFSSSWRPVPIKKEVVKYRKADEKPALAAEAVKRCIAGGGKSLVFCNSRARVNELTEFFRKSGLRAAGHHAGLLREERAASEEGFAAQPGNYDVIVCTSTVEMGINLPARQVIIYDSSTFDGVFFNNIPVWSYIQRMGRAGRPGLDTKGECILLHPKWAGGSDKYIHEQCEPVDSQFTDPRSLMEQVLIEVNSGYSRTRSELREGFLKNSFYFRQHPSADLTVTVNKMLASDLLTVRKAAEAGGEDILGVTLLGKMAVKLMFCTETVADLLAVRETLKVPTLFDIFLLAAVSPDMAPVLYANNEELDEICRQAETLRGEFLPMTVDRIMKLFPDIRETKRLLSAVKMAVICILITEGVPAAELSKTYSVYEADLNLMRENAVRVLTGMAAVCAAADRRDKARDEEDDSSAENAGDEPVNREQAKPKRKSGLSLFLQQAADMLRYGVGEEMFFLTQMRNVGGVTARTLYHAGFRTPEALKAATAAELEKLPGIGKKLAGSIIGQAESISQRTLPGNSRGTVRLTCRAPRIKPKDGIDPYRLKRSLELSAAEGRNEKYRVTGGRDPHIVSWKEGTYRCDCMDFLKNGESIPCKHILCVRHEQGDEDVIKMVRKLDSRGSMTLREAVPSLWYDPRKERRQEDV